MNVSLDVEIARLERRLEIARLEQKLADLKQAHTLSGRNGMVLVVSSQEPNPASEEFAEMFPLEAIRIILKRKGEATTRELHDDLLAGGLRRTRATDLINSIGATLSKATKSKTSDIVKRKEGKVNYWSLKTTEATAPVGGKAPTRRRPANYYYQQNPADTVG